MEGTGGLLNAGRAIIGASVGSGVAAGASTALGHSDIANVASGLIGGVTGRSVGRILQNRRIRQQNEVNQQIPLLQGTGNRFGGREEESRLTANIQDPTNNQQSITPPPAETRRSRNPYTK
jgi:hypothetical protein